MPEKLRKTAENGLYQSPYPEFSQTAEFLALLFAPEHIPWLAGPVSVPGRTAGQGVLWFTVGSVTWSVVFVNGLGRVVI